MTYPHPDEYETIEAYRAAVGAWEGPGQSTLDEIAAGERHWAEYLIVALFMLVPALIGVVTLVLKL